MPKSQNTEWTDIFGNKNYFVFPYILKIGETKLSHPKFHYIDSAATDISFGILICWSN